MKRNLMIFMVILALTSMACQISFNAPAAQPGVTKTFTVSQPAPAAGQQARVKLEMGAGELTINGGSDELVSGTITYNLNNWDPVVEQNGDVIRIFQEAQTVPIPEGSNVVNRWDLQLGSTPMELDIQAGAYDGKLNLGGVPLLNLDIRSGASNTIISFDELNPQSMDAFNMETGASNVELLNLANANFERMKFTGAAGSYSLDFGGDLQQDANVDVNGAIGEITISVPAGQAAQVMVAGGLRDVNTRGSWDVVNDTYSLPGKGPKLTITVEMSIGSLNLFSE